MTYPELVLSTQGVVAYWRLNRHPTDQSQYSLVNPCSTGIYENAVTPGDAQRQDFSPSCEFDGVNQAIRFGNFYGFEGRQPFSFEFWMQTPTISAGSFLRVISKEDLVTAVRDGWFVFISPMSTGADAGKLRFVRNLANISDSSAVTATAIPLDTPTHIVGTFDGTLKQMWMNGVSGPLAGTGFSMIANAANFVMMRAANGGDYCSGMLQDVSLYDRKLGAGEIETHYLIGKLPPKFLSNRWNAGAMVTPSNTLDGPFPMADTPLELFEGLFIGGAGNVAVVQQNDVVVTFNSVPAGTVLPVKGRRVNSTGTTATGIGAYRRV